jgi:hypothetical protein
MAATLSWTDEAGKFYFVTLDTYDEETHGLSAEVTKFPTEGAGVVSDHVRLGNRTLQLVGFVSNTPLPQNDEKGRYASRDLDGVTTAQYTTNSTRLDMPEPPLKLNAASLLTAGFNKLFGSAPEATMRIRINDLVVAVSATTWTLDDPQRTRVAEVWELLAKAHLARLRVDVATESLGLVPGLIITELSAPIKTEDGDGAPFSISLEQIRTVSAETVDAPKPLERMGQKKKSSGNKSAEPQTEEERLARRKSLSLQLGLATLNALTGRGFQ